MEPYEFIEGHQLVLNRFGMWPSFHDGEVHRIVLDRTARSAAGPAIPKLELQIRGWIMVAEGSGSGLYKQECDSVVHFLFEDIADFELEGFNQQNVLTSLNLAVLVNAENGATVLHVELEHCYEFCGEFSARKAKILKVVPYSDGEYG
jgi:hypothetical protein